MNKSKGLEHWVALLTHAELPVLKRTARALSALREDDKRLNAHAISVIIAKDPMMTVKLLRYLQQHKHKVQTAEVIQVEQALLMLGIEPFFKNVPPQPLAEEMLKTNLMAIPPMLRVLNRSHRASVYAWEWAVRLHDFHYEEVSVAALLHDIAEILMWCFAPDLMLEIYGLQQKDRTMHSRDAQHKVFGFTLADLQKELALQWGLPELLLMLMSDSNTRHQRVRNVRLAVDLARHSANGWDDAALPDDYTNIGELLRIPATEVMTLLGVDAGIACDINKLH